MTGKSAEVLNGPISVDPAPDNCVQLRSGAEVGNSRDLSLLVDVVGARVLAAKGRKRDLVSINEQKGLGSGQGEAADSPEVGFTDDVAMLIDPEPLHILVTFEHAEVVYGKAAPDDRVHLIVVVRGGGPDDIAMLIDSGSQAKRAA